MNLRIRQFISQLDTHRLDAYLVTHPVNVSYLSRFPAEEAWLLVSPKKTYYITDFRYVLEARAGLRGISVQVYRSSMISTVRDLICKLTAKRIGFDAQVISLHTYRQLKRECPSGISFIDAGPLIDDMRAIKTKDEIFNIQKAIQVTQHAYDFLKHVIKPGLTESQVLLRLERHIKSQGYTFSFRPIIASGPNSCQPHAKITHRRILANDIVLVDMGIDVNGYKSDLTRMFFLGKIPALVKEITQAVAEAQKCAIAKIRPGIAASVIDDQARNFLRKRKLAKFFGHSLGHGVGLEVHERPRISQKSKTILKPGMIFTIEPAVYLPHKFGVRLEDMILVTQKGYQVLSY